MHVEWLVLHAAAWQHAIMYGSVQVRPCRAGQTSCDDLKSCRNIQLRMLVQAIVAVLNKLSKVALPKEIVIFIHDSTANYGKVCFAAC